MKADSARHTAADAEYDTVETAAFEGARPVDAQGDDESSRVVVDPRRVDALDAEIGQLARRMHTESYRMLLLVREFDERFGYTKWCYKSCAEWLAARLQISVAAAREKVRTAQALRFLPKISAAFAEGVISYTKARELSRVAREHDEDLLLAYARDASAPQVTERCRQIRNVRPESADDARRAWERRSLSVARNPTRNTLLISVELPAEDGEIVLRALECAVASGEVVALGVDHLAAHGEIRSKTDGWLAQQADALVAVSRAYLAGDVGDVDELGVDAADTLGDEVGRDLADSLGDEVGRDLADARGDGLGDARGDNAEIVLRSNPDAHSSGELGEAVSNGAGEQNATTVAFFMSNDPLTPPASNGVPRLKTQRWRKRGTSVADHYQIVVHVDEKALRDCGRHGAASEVAVHGANGGYAAGDGGGGGSPPRSDLPLETIRRLACDCSLIALVEDSNGKPLGISRKTRLVPPSLRRALLARDRGCTFPGCPRRSYLDAHHIEHWINKGLTVPENLTMLCTYHHRLLHEGGFSIRKLDDDTLVFLRPDGRVIPRSGYRHEDMVDDVVGTAAVATNEVREDEVRETAPRYGPALRAVS